MWFCAGAGSCIGAIFDGRLKSPPLPPNGIKLSRFLPPPLPDRSGVRVAPDLAWLRENDPVASSGPSLSRLSIECRSEWALLPLGPLVGTSRVPYLTEEERSRLKRDNPNLLGLAEEEWTEADEGRLSDCGSGAVVREMAERREVGSVDVVAAEVPPDGRLTGNSRALRHRRAERLDLVVCSRRERRYGLRVLPPLARARSSIRRTTPAASTPTPTGDLSTSAHRLAKGPGLELALAVDGENLVEEALAGFHAFAAEVRLEGAIANEGLCDEGRVGVVDGLGGGEEGREGRGEVGAEGGEVGLGGEELGRGGLGGL